MTASLGLIWPDKGQADWLVQSRRVVAGGHPSSHAIAIEYQMALQGNRCIGVINHKANLAAPKWRFIEFLNTATANEEGFFLGDSPAHIDFIRIRHGIGVLADNNMAFFQTQNSLCFDTKGLDIELSARGDQGIPERFATVLRYMHLVTQFADKADANYSGRNTGNAAFTNAHIGKSFAV